MAHSKLCPWCRTGLHDQCSNVSCDCTHDDPTATDDLGDPMTVVPCPHCDRTCAGPQGLSAHIRSMHPDKVGKSGHEAPEPGNAATNGNGLVWEEPPKRGRRSEIVPAIVALIPELRRNPAKWARLYTWKGKSSAQGAKKVLAAREDLEDIEFSANVIDGGSALYGRYVEAE